jgi:hypothetical protein
MRVGKENDLSNYPVHATAACWWICLTGVEMSGKRVTSADRLEPERKPRETLGRLYKGERRNSTGPPQRQPPLPLSPTTTTRSKGQERKVEAEGASRGTTMGEARA